MSKTFLPLTRRSVVAGLVSLVALSRASIALAQPAQPTAGGTLNLLITAEPPSLVSLTSTSVLNVSARVTEGLIEFDTEMNPHPQLATDWTVSDDALTYTFTLRPGVKWHDGTDFTSADVAYSIATLKTAHPRGRTTFAQVESIETPDLLTVVLKLTQPTSYLFKALSAAESPIVPKHIYEGSDPAANPANNAPIGTGPYVFKEWARGSYILYEKNANYWDAPKPYVDQLIIRIIPDQAARSVGFETGELDAGYRTPVALNDVQRLSGLPNLAFEPKGYEYSPPNSVCVEFNLDREIFGNLKVRQAFAHAVDRDAICKVVFFGKAVPAPSPIVPGLTAFYNPMPSPYPYDLDKAAALLDEAGYPVGADGKRFSFFIDHPADDAMKRTAEYLRSVLSRLNIDATIRGVDMGTHVARVYTDRDFDLQIASLSPLFDPQVGVQRTFWSKNFVKGVPFSNATHYANAEVDALLEASAIELDQQERVKMWWRIQEIVMTEVPDLNLVMPSWETIHNINTFGMADTAAGFEGTLASVYKTV